MDDELQRIREQKLKEMEQKLHQKETATVITVNQAAFHDLLAQHPRFVIDFWAEWCGPCRMVAPVIEELAAEFAGRVAFGKCNTDHNPRISSHYGISAIPTIMLFSHGQMVERIIGAYPKDAIRSKIIRTFQI